MVRPQRAAGIKEKISGVINSRGDIRVFGRITRDIKIKDPRTKGFLASIKIKDKGVATSGDYLQNSGNFENSHILNSTKASVTVTCKKLFEADLYSTLFSVLELIIDFSNINIVLFI